MKGIGIALAAIALLYYGFLNFSPLDRLSRQPMDFLTNQYRDLNKALESHDREMTIPDGGMERLAEMRSERMWTSLELKRRESGIGFWIPAVGAAGIALILVSFLPLSRKRQEAVEMEEQPVAEREPREVGIYVAPPREVYVDEWEFERQQEGGFATREEAVAWLTKDPLKKCDYCGAEMRPTPESGREGLELVTFYKKVPTGAKDLRVVLASRWFVKAASELRCVGCERLVRR